MTIGNVDRNDSRQIPSAPSQSFCVSCGRAGSGNWLQLLPHRFQLGRLDNRRQERRQRIRDDPLSRSRHLAHRGPLASAGLRGPVR